MTSWLRRIVEVVERSGVQRVRQRGDACRQPDTDDGARGAGQRRHGMRSQWMTDRDVAFHRERRDGQD